MLMTTKLFLGTEEPTVWARMAFVILPNNCLMKVGDGKKEAGKVGIFTNNLSQTDCISQK